MARSIWRKMILVPMAQSTPQVSLQTSLTTQKWLSFPGTKSWCLRKPMEQNSRNSKVNLWSSQRVQVHSSEMLCSLYSALTSLALSFCPCRRLTSTWVRSRAMLRSTIPTSRSPNTWKKSFSTSASPTSARQSEQNRHSSQTKSASTARSTTITLEQYTTRRKQKESKTCASRRVTIAAFACFSTCSLANWFRQRKSWSYAKVKSA